MTLVPRVDSSGRILNDITAEDYVLFGKYRHKTGDDGSGTDAEATPILWRVMSTDVDVNPTNRGQAPEVIQEAATSRRSSQRQVGTWTTA